MGCVRSSLRRDASRHVAADRDPPSCGAKLALFHSSVFAVATLEITKAGERGRAVWSGAVAIGRCIHNRQFNACRISVGALPVQRLKACVNALTS